MKKIIILFAIILFCAVACVEPLQPYLGPVVDNEPTDAATMTLQFSIPISPATKGAMQDTPDITEESTVHVFVYNTASGALLQVSKATLSGTVEKNTPWGTAESAIEYHADFVVEVNIGSAHRHLQIVVDAPTHTKDATNHNDTGIGYVDNNVNNTIYIGDSETDVASKLYTTGGETAYWQRIDLPNGLQAYTYPGGEPEKGNDWTYTGPHSPYDYYVDGKGQTVYVGDFVNASGHKITDGTGYVMSTDVANRVKFIPLVRNFVKIEVSKADNGTFTPLKAVLINVPKSGFVAPYSSASGFVSYYLKDEYLNRLQEPEDPETDVKYGTEGIVSTGYTAPVPNNEFVTECPAESKCVEAENGIIPLYMYERGVATSNPTQVLVKGYFGNDSSNPTWLKIDITDTDGHYIAFYRDITYEMEIGAITGTSGHGTMQEAYDMPSVGNPSSSPETETLTQVSDGQGTTIWVDFIEHASFKQEGETVRLRYKFVGNSKTSADAVLTVTHLTGTAGGAVDADDHSTLTGSSYNGTDTQDGSTGWYYVDVPLVDQGSTTKRSVVRVSGTATNDLGKTVTLYRDVTFSVMPTQMMTVSMSSLASDAKNMATTATITLPDGLGYALFPLVIRIEPYNGSLTPTDDDLPVGHGTSTFKTLVSDPNSQYYDEDTYNNYHRTSNYYWYEKTISYDEYHAGTRTYTANFTTIYDSGNETVVAFSDPDGHFYTVVAELKVPPVGITPSNTQNVKGSETSATFRFNVNENNISNFSWSISNVSEGADFDDFEGNSTGDVITMTFQPRAQSDPAKTYTATLTYSYTDANNETQTNEVQLKVNQAELVHKFRKVEATATSFTKPNANNVTSLTLTDTDHPSSNPAVTFNFGQTGISYNNNNNANNRYISSSDESAHSLVFDPADDVTITGVNFTWSSGTTSYRPGSPVSITIEGGTTGSITVDQNNHNLTGSWNTESGIEGANWTVSMTRRDRWNNFRLYVIGVSYYYMVDEGWE